MSIMEIKDFSKNYMHRPLRTSPIEVVTIHSLQGGKSTLEAVDEWYQQRIRDGYASCSNFVVSYDGKVGLYVPLTRRAATSSCTKNDNRAITIEVATEKNSPTYSIFKEAEEGMIDLLVRICKVHGKKGLQMLTEETKFDKAKDGYFGITLHRWFSDTDCPGNDIIEKLPAIVDEVNRRLNETIKMYTVQVGAYKIKSNAEKKLAKVKAAGFSDAWILEREVEI